ncbi:MAG: HEAT repeat domain-containing protein [Crocinitomicaceae bacterium]|nr:HEAT repeat domain-containing protein [Crocinitomicaceae bacterium]
MKSLEKSQKIEKLAYNKYIQHSAVVDEPNDLITFAEKKVAKITKQQQAKLNALSIELKSGNETKISAAIKILQTNGHANILPELVELLKTKPSQKIRAELMELLNDLRDSSVAETMIELIKDENNNSVLQELLSAIWASKVDYSQYLPEFIAIAVDGDFMIALECLTIIENLEGPFEERLVLESQLHLRDYVEDSTPKEEKKAKIMSEIALIIKDLDNMDHDDIDFFNE